MGNQAWPARLSEPSALSRHGSLQGSPSPISMIVRDFVDHPDIAEYVFDVYHPGLERQEPDEARMWRTSAVSPQSQVIQRLASRGPLARHRVSRFRCFSDVPGHNNFVNRSGAPLTTVVKRRRAFHIKEGNNQVSDTTNPATPAPQSAPQQSGEKSASDLQAKLDQSRTREDHGNGRDICVRRRCPHDLRLIHREAARYGQGPVLHIRQSARPQSLIGLLAALRRSHSKTTSNQAQETTDGPQNTRAERINAVCHRSLLQHTCG